MKKFISLLLCLLLICSISIISYATNVDAIQPNTNVIVIGVTGYDVPVYGVLPTHHDGTSLVIIPNQYLEGTYINPITQQPVQTTKPTTSTTETTTIDDSEISSKVKLNLICLFVISISHCPTKF